MRRRGRRSVEPVGLSFLDAVFCGFGAVVLLFVILRVGAPGVVAADSREMEAEMRVLREELAALATAIDRRREALRLSRESGRRAEELVSRYQAELAALAGEHRAAQDTAAIQNRLEDRLERARQELTEEMRRLLAQRPAPRRDEVGGIPVDSEYIVFIIDTSGSMQSRAWSLMRRKVEEALAVYPRVEGIQVLNDMGEPMFSQYRGRWIPDSPARRRAIVRRLADWQPFSNSSPVEGIEQAIRAYYAPDKRISLYVLGDEFSGRSIDTVVREIDRLNRPDPDGRRRVRIHAVGFPVMFGPGAGSDTTGVRFAVLMRELTRRNGGTFVGLPDLQP